MKIKYNDFLLERSTSNIKSFDAKNLDIHDTKKLLEAYELLYELEYKYNTISSYPFFGNEDRKNNILSLIENKSKDLIKKLSETLIYTYNDWLEYHNISEPYELARKRLEDFDDYFETIFSEYTRYTDGNFQKFIYEIENNQEDYPETMDELSNHTNKDDMYDILEDSLESFNDNFGTNFENKYDAEKYIEDYTIYISDIIYDKETFKNYVTSEAAYIELYAEMIFPLWYAEWEYQGIDEIVSDNKEHLEKLKNISNNPLNTQFVIFSAALNGVHVTGDMIEHYDNDFNISKDDLDELSNKDVSDWNKELKEIGVNIK